MCTLRPLRTKRSLGSVSSFSSFTSASSMASASAATSPASQDPTEPRLVGMSLQEALKGSQILLDEIDLSLLQRTLFYRSSLDMDSGKYAQPVIDQSLSHTSSLVIAYWNSCLSLIREELDAVHKTIVKSHLLVARTKRDVEKKTRDDELELTEAIMVWETQQTIGDKPAPKEQTRGRAFTAPARMAESPSDSDHSQRFWMQPSKRWPISGSTTPSDTAVSPSEMSPTRSSRVASFIKQKLRPLSRSRQRNNLCLQPDHEDTVLEIGHHMSQMSLYASQYSSSHSVNRPIARSVSTRGTIRKAPVLLTRLHTDLLRMEEYCRGVRLYPY